MKFTCVSGTDPNQFLNDLLNEILDHGYGEIKCIVDTGKGHRMKLLIQAGKQYVFFYEKRVEHPAHKLL